MTTTDVQGKIVTNGGMWHLWGDGITDGVETELKVRDITGNLRSVGEILNGQTLQELLLQCSDGSILTSAKLYGPDGGVLASWRGNERTTHQFANLHAAMLSIPMRKGTVLKVTTAD